MTAPVRMGAGPRVPPACIALEMSPLPCDHDRMTRIPELQGACNFRDFGGYETIDGRRVRWGRLYRSGVMHRFTEADRAKVAGFGVRLICDLRRPDERASQPNPDFGPGVSSVCWDEIQDSALMQSLPEPSAVDGSLARKVMLRHYAGMPTRLAAHVRGMFHALAHGPGSPMILHCTAGKDRTGFSAALLLSALGVPRDAIVEDYLLTNASADLRARLVKDESGFGLAPSTRFIMELQPEAREAVLAADADYLRAAFTAIEVAHGTVDDYLRAVLGVDDATRKSLERTMLTRGVRYSPF